MDAGLIHRLGYELVSRQETAVAELVKNAFDADAILVDLIFSDTEKPGGTLEVRDNGVGMSRLDLINGFMRLSSISKISNPVSLRYNRIRAGRKGIGRFAVQRLGTKLTITTKILSEDKALRVVIDWDQFVPGKDLYSITSHIQEVDVGYSEGTTLLIDNLRDEWTDAEMRRVWRYVADLLQPFPLSKSSPKLKVDPGFRADLYKKNGNDLVVIADEVTQIYDYAIAEVSAYVDEQGHGSWEIFSKLFSIREVQPIGRRPDDPSEPFQALRKIRFKAYYFIYQASLLPPMMDGVIRKMANEYGGIRLYRNGFRVLPYGEPGNDWLGLDSAYGRRIILVPISNQNFFGFFEVDDLEGVQFEETASREGLIDNSGLKELTSFGYRVLRAAVLRFAEVRQKKGLSQGRNTQLESPPEEKVRKAINELQQIFEKKDPVENSFVQDEVSNRLEQLKEDFEEYTEKTDSIADELGMMRVLASLGIVIGEFTHEVKGTVTAASINARDVAEDPRVPEPLKEVTSSLKGQLERVNSYTQYFDRTVSENSNRDKTPRDIRKIVKSFVREHKESARRRLIHLDDMIVGYQLYTCPMHGSEIDSILFNFYSNSIKAIRRKNFASGRILISAGRFEDGLYIEFSDNGIGVPKENEDRIFNAFFTTSTLGSREDEDLRGSGLGLKIIKDIVNAYGGSVYIKNPPENFVTCFRVEIPSGIIR